MENFFQSTKKEEVTVTKVTTKVLEVTQHKDSLESQLIDVGKQRDHLKYLVEQSANDIDEKDKLF